MVLGVKILNLFLFNSSFKLNVPFVSVFLFYFNNLGKHKGGRLEETG